MKENDSIAYLGNLTRLSGFLQRAREGARLTVGFIGGSITNGSLASVHENCYAARTVEWLKKTYPLSEFTYVNAGIGGTTSHFGVARCVEDLLVNDPDLVVTEFSVNDENSLFYRETYEGLIRKVYGWSSRPAVIILHNVMYADGTNAQDQHETVGRHYHIPCISVKTSIYQKVAEGDIPVREITPDDLHPNDLGHKMISELLSDFFKEVAEGKYGLGVSVDGEPGEDILPSPITENRYENAKRIYRSCFIGKEKGDSVTVECEGSEIAAQYIRFVKHPACVAKAVVDEDEEHAVILDGNFDETWGDKLDITLLQYHGKKEKHRVKITITEGDGDCVPFNLVSLIVS